MARYVGPAVPGPAVPEPAAVPSVPSPYGIGQIAAPVPPAILDRPVDIRDEIVFWGRQLSDHALFMQLGLVEPRLQATAAQMHRAWETYRPRWAQIAPSQAASEARYMAAELRSFKTEVLDRLNRGEWLGWLFPSFVAHTRSELDYFVSRINGQMNARQETCDWLRFMADHAAFAKHLLDPHEVALIEAAQTNLGTLSQIHNACAAQTAQNLLVLSRQAGADLDAYFTQSGIGTPRVKSIVHPVLLAHVQREGRRFLAVVDNLSASGAQV